MQVDPDDRVLLLQKKIKGGSGNKYAIFGMEQKRSNELLNVKKRPKK